MPTANWSNQQKELLGGLKNFHDKIVSADVYMTIQPTKKGKNKEVEVRVFLPGHIIYAFGDSDHFMDATKIVFNNEKRQLAECKNSIEKPK